MFRQKVRLYGLDAPLEIRSKDPEEKAKELESHAFVRAWFGMPGALLVRTVKEQKNRRMLVDCFQEEESSL